MFENLNIIAILINVMLAILSLIIIMIIILTSSTLLPNKIKLQRYCRNTIYEEWRKIKMVKLNKIIFSVDDKNFKYHANSPGYLTDQ